MDEVVTQILEAAKGEDPTKAAEAVAVLMNHRIKAEADKIHGAEEAVKGLKTAKEKAEEKLKLYAELGKPEELAAAKKELDEIKRKAEAAEHGVDNSEVDKLVEQRVAQQLKTHAAEYQDQTEKLTARAESAEADREQLEAKLLRTMQEFELYRAAGPDVEPIFWDVLVDKAAPYLKPVTPTNGAEELRWWTAKKPGFELHDPESNMKLMKKDGTTQMTAADLVEAKKAGDWAPMFRPKGRGAGSHSTQSPEASKKTVTLESPIHDYFAAALAGGST